MSFQLFHRINKKIKAELNAYIAEHYIEEQYATEEYATEENIEERHSVEQCAAEEYAAQENIKKQYLSEQRSEKQHVMEPHASEVRTGKDALPFSKTSGAGALGRREQLSFASAVNLEVSKPEATCDNSLETPNPKDLYDAAEPKDVCDSVCAPQKTGRTLDEVIGNIDKSFMELVFSFADEKGISDVEVQKRANLDRKAFSKLKCGTTKNPSKATALALAVALRLNLDETKDLISRAGFALSPCSKRDIIVQFFIERDAYDIYEINNALYEHGEQLLGSQT